MQTLVRKCLICGIVFGCVMNNKKYNCYDCAKPCELCENNHEFDITTGVCEPCIDSVAETKRRQHEESTEEQESSPPKAKSSWWN